MMSERAVIYPAVRVLEENVSPYNFLKRVSGLIICPRYL